MNYGNEKLRICEIFDSISGEGLNAGTPATFVRFSGCNLQCTFCDTRYHNSDVEFKGKAEEVFEHYGHRLQSNEYVILTGGEPSVQNRYELILFIDGLRKYGTRHIEIETNGKNFDQFYKSLEAYRYPLISYSVDFKIEEMENPDYTMGAFLGYQMLGKQDCIKVVVSDTEEINFAKKLADKFQNTNVIVSPCYNMIEPVEIANYIISNNFRNVKMQIQLHKYLWGNELGK